MEQSLGCLLELAIAMLPKSAQGCVWFVLLMGVAVLVAWLIWGW